MKSSSYFPVMITLAALGLAGVFVFNFQQSTSSSGSPQIQSDTKPAQVTSIPGIDRKAVVLTERAAERLDIKTAIVVREQGLVIPYAAVMYDADGSTWVYTNLEPLVYVRHRIEVDRIERDRALLSSGPPVGTTVVTVGAAELFGVEFGVGK